MGAIRDGIRALAKTMREHGYSGEVSVTLPPREWARFVYSEVTVQLFTGSSTTGGGNIDVVTLETDYERWRARRGGPRGERPHRRGPSLGRWATVHLHQCPRDVPGPVRTRRPRDAAAHVLGTK